MKMTGAPIFAAPRKISEGILPYDCFVESKNRELVVSWRGYRCASNLVYHSISNSVPIGYYGQVKRISCPFLTNWGPLNPLEGDRAVSQMMKALLRVPNDWSQLVRALMLISVEP